MTQTFCKLSYTRYSRRFRVPVKTSRGIAETREGILVSLENARTPPVKTEIAPWSGFGCETLDEAEKALSEIAEKPFPVETIPEITKHISDLPCTCHALSAAHFLWENPKAIMSSEPSASRVCKLILRDSAAEPEAVFEQILRSREKGYRTFKIKIGLCTLNEEIRFAEKLLAFAKTSSPETKIRLDANGAWNHRAALTALASLNAFPQLEFIEQPLAASPENDAAVYALPPLDAKKIALDESLREPWEMPTGTLVVAIVKPLLIGNFPRLRTWLLAEKNAPRFVISSVFETEVGRIILRELCSSTRNNPRALAAGIATQHSYAQSPQIKNCYQKYPR